MSNKTIYYLYIKTHNKTGLKYLGQTKQNPYKYYGAGTYWKKHLKENGWNTSTQIIHQSNNKNEISDLGRKLSEEWNIVESSQWANKIPETGGGGGGPKGENHYMFGKHWDDEYKQKMSEKLKTRIFTEEHKKNLCESRKRTIKIQCPYCKKIGDLGGMKRWHFNKCKSIQDLF